MMILIMRKMKKTNKITKNQNDRSNIEINDTNKKEV